MDKTSMMQIAAASFGMAIGAFIRTRYLEWKRNRPEILISQDWRGRLVADRKVRLFERSLFWAWVVVTMFAFIVSYYSLTGDPIL